MVRISGQASLRENHVFDVAAIFGSHRRKALVGFYLLFGVQN
jgi:hypothetical protein